jgi:hypothetical protein
MTVDPEKLQGDGLDRKSTLLLQASREPTHETEKDEMAGLEERAFSPLFLRSIATDER